MNYKNPSLWRDFGATLMGMLLAQLLIPGVLFAFQSAPTSQTALATHITEKSAILHGTVNSNEMPDTLQWFEWGISGQNVVYETPKVNIRGQAITTNANIIGLAPTTQYFFRQISENSRGKNVGSTMYFTTKALPQVINPIIVVQTTPATSVMETSAMLKGYVSPHGNRTARFWFEWGITNTLANQTTPTLVGSNSRTVELTIRKLTPGTIYFYRLVGDNGVGRVHGATRVFVTAGTAPVSEAERAQNIPIPQEGSDGVTRNITDNDGKSVPGGVQGNVFQQGMPGDFLGNFLRNRKNPDADGMQTTDGTATPEVQGATAPGTLARLFGAISGGKGVVVTIEKVGPSKAPVHTPVEYKIMYAYRLNAPSLDGRLKVTLPAEVVYIGDNTTNELLLEESAGPERTYVLPIARLEKGTTRTISILGMTTGDAKGFPDAYARVEFVDSNGKLQIIAAGEGAIDENTQAGKANNAAAAAATSNGILPSSFIGWLFYIALVAGAIFVARKAKAYYDQRKEELAEEVLEAEHPKAEQDTTKWLDEIRAHKNHNGTLPT